MAYDFDKIARTYDRLNRVMTLGLDRRWRRLGARTSSSAWVGGRERPRSQVLDVACGTGDMAVSLAERGCTVTGVDISEEMLAIARKKFTPQSLCDSSPVPGEQPDSSNRVSHSSPVPGEHPDSISCVSRSSLGTGEQPDSSNRVSRSPGTGEQPDSSNRVSRSSPGTGEQPDSSNRVSRSSPGTGEQPDSSNRVSRSSPGKGEVPGGRRGEFILADAEHLPFGDECFDAVTCAFGVRNFVHLEQGLSEMLRVLKPGGKLVILELATPDSPLILPFYNLYTRRVIPLLGKWLAGNREAYTYLPQSIERFPKGEAFLRLLGDRVAKHATERKLCFGVCRMYTINKEAAR